jgi:hypothetical protein
MGKTTREREEEIARSIAELEQYQKDLEAKGIKGWEGSKFLSKK